jgi:hypothetical protein
MSIVKYNENGLLIFRNSARGILALGSNWRIILVSRDEVGPP